MKAKHLEAVILESALASLNIFKTSVLVAMNSRDNSITELEIWKAMKEFMRDTINVERLSKAITNNIMQVVNMNLEMGDEITLDLEPDKD